MFPGRRLRRDYCIAVLTYDNFKSANLHSMWSDCGHIEGNLSKCTQNKAYLPPGVLFGPNRYVFVLFSQPEKLVLKKALKTGGFDFGNFLHTNPSLRALAWNFMSVTGDGVPHKKGLRKSRRVRRAA